MVLKTNNEQLKKILTIMESKEFILQCDKILRRKRNNLQNERAYKFG